LDLIDGFIARYVKEYDYYEQAARMAAQMLQSGLEAAGIRSIVTSRAKSATRLAEKCQQRNKRRALRVDRRHLFRHRGSGRGPSSPVLSR
jgi:ppGpp synthetase/RelA/SpoT-type nucleotidyltranferase